MVSEKTTWMASVVRGSSIRRASSPQVPTAIAAYWLPVAGSSPAATDQVSPRSWRPTRSGSRARTVAQSPAVVARTAARAAVARTRRRSSVMRPSSGGPKEVAEVNSTFSGPNRVVAPRRAPTRSGLPTAPRPRTESWLVALPTPNSTVNRCPRWPRRSIGRSSSGAPAVARWSRAAESRSAGRAERPQSPIRRAGDAPYTCVPSAPRTQTSRTRSDSRARWGCWRVENAYRTASWPSTTGRTRPSISSARAVSPGTRRQTAARSAPSADAASTVKATAERQAPRVSSPAPRLRTSGCPVYAPETPSSTVKTR